MEYSLADPDDNQSYRRAKTIAVVTHPRMFVARPFTFPPTMFRLFVMYMISSMKGGPSN
jgi:hypothetical protein